MSHIYVASGRKVDLTNPKLSDICVEDIAHHLSHICRFTGSLQHFYSVAEHAVALSRCVPAHMAYAALHHDDHEYVLGDVSSPLKGLIDAASGGYYSELAARWQEQIDTVLGVRRLSEAEAAVLHEADQNLRVYEAQLLMKGVARGPFERLPFLSLPMLTPVQARAAYLERHEELR